MSDILQIYSVLSLGKITRVKNEGQYTIRKKNNTDRMIKANVWTINMCRLFPKEEFT